MDEQAESEAIAEAVLQEAQSKAAEQFEALLQRDNQVENVPDRASPQPADPPAGPTASEKKKVRKRHSRVSFEFPSAQPEENSAAAAESPEQQHQKVREETKKVKKKRKGKSKIDYDSHESQDGNGPEKAGLAADTADSIPAESAPSQNIDEVAPDTSSTAADTEEAVERPDSQTAAPNNESVIDDRTTETGDGSVSQTELQSPTKEQEDATQIDDMDATEPIRAALPIICEPAETVDPDEEACDRKVKSDEAAESRENDEETDCNLDNENGSDDETKQSDNETDDVHQHAGNGEMSNDGEDAGENRQVSEHYAVEDQNNTCDQDLHKANEKDLDDEKKEGHEDMNEEDKCGDTVDSDVERSNTKSEYKQDQINTTVDTGEVNHDPEIERASKAALDDTAEAGEVAGASPTQRVESEPNVNEESSASQKALASKNRSMKYEDLKRRLEKLAATEEAAKGEAESTEETPEWLNLTNRRRRGPEAAPTDANGQAAVAQKQQSAGQAQRSTKYQQQGQPSPRSDDEATANANGGLQLQRLQSEEDTKAAMLQLEAESGTDLLDAGDGGGDGGESGRRGIFCCFKICFTRNAVCPTDNESV